MTSDLYSIAELASDQQQSVDPFPGEWHVLYTKSRQEKLLGEDLAAMRIPYCLPLIQKVHYQGARRARVSIATPLFPGYVFIQGALDIVYRADRTGRVARIVPVFNQMQFHWELTNLRMAILSEVPLDAYPYLKKGVRVEVTSGPLQGLQGVVEDRPRPDRLILQVDLLSRGVSLEIDASLLDPIQ